MTLIVRHNRLPLNVADQIDNEIKLVQSFFKL